MSGERLPVAEPADVRRAAAELVRADGRVFAGVLALNGAAALAGLAGPWLLGRIVDELQIDVFAFGILTDFQTRLFPGSQRMVELCDKLEVLQVHSLCWCGLKATHNARTVDGEMVLEGEQIVVGDTAALGEAPSVIAYEVLCRQHHRRRMTRAAVAASRSEPLPFERDLEVGP